MIIDKIIDYLGDGAKKRGHNDEDIIVALIFCIILASTVSIIGLINMIQTVSIKLLTTILLPSTIAVIVIAEIFFHLESAKPKCGKSTFWFTAERKLTNLAESSILIFVPLGVGWLVWKYLVPLSQTHGTLILTAIGLVAAIVGTIVLYISINSLKYRNPELTKKPRQKK